MSSVATAVQDLKGGSDAVGVRVGRVVDITKEGHPIVDYPGNTLAPVRARSAIVLSTGHDRNKVLRTPVLLVFENGDAASPIIIGVVNDRLLTTAEEQVLVESDKRPANIVVDGKMVTFDAEKEIFLRCGKASITLRADGKIVVKGTQLISRASVTNKIKGGSVSIN